MKNVALLHINFDGADQRSYESVTCEVFDKDGHRARREVFATGNPSHDWSDAIHYALSLGQPILHAACCDSFVASGDGYAWGTDPGKKLVLKRVSHSAPEAGNGSVRAAGSG